ncbi:glycosyltransferase [Colwellia sp. 2_MG-2023]|nr:glycosyltransferase [Colwellia sp. 2_MG-2023]MBU2925114.1 tetratricopeptide repeat protein [Colwellia sp. C2M11]MDO6653389.1 tetratricopeptide repeat protein [Colwellia sp. 3_MG-2023]MDO6666173.1 tetratricopeptide repeat protein [Colwellia sp. 2_MG-2023]
MNKGGTVGYLSSLLDGMERLGTFKSADGLRHAFLFPDIGPDDRLPNDLIEHLKFNTPFTSAYEDTHHKKFFDKSEWFHSSIPLSEALKVNLRKITSVHIHGAYNFLPVYNFLRLCGIENDVVKILTTHNPWKPELEDIFHFNKAKTPEQLQRDLPQEAAYRHYLQMRDEFAFKMADVLFFPSEHSMDGYHESWPEFTEIVKDKPVYFATTGTEAKEVNVPRNAMRKSLGIPDDARVFLYLGRFIPMRGFDLYTEVANKILKTHKNAYFLAVGETRKTPAINHERWIEVGHTSSPGDFINMADACVMANRGSYFDLSMVEALAQGIHLIAAKVGGYKYLEGKTSGVTFFERESMEGLFQACEAFCQMSNKDINQGKQDNLALYTKEMTPEKFAQGYQATIDKMYTDLGIKSKDRDIVRSSQFFSQPSNSKPNAAPSAPLVKQTISDKVASKNLNQYKTKEHQAMSLFKQGQYQDSIDLFYKAINEKPKNARLKRLLAEVLLSAGRRSEAIKQLEIARELLPNNKNLRKRFYTMRYGKLLFGLADKPFQ